TVADVVDYFVGSAEDFAGRAVGIGEEIETAKHIEKLRSMRRDRNTQAGTGIAMAGTMPRPQAEQRVG
ncbi:hypothetical protein ACUOFC_01720, partial [Escherichia sp. TWPC-MK]